jgi:acyl carrier protein
VYLRLDHLRAETLAMEQRPTIESDVRRFISDNFPLGGGGDELDSGTSLLEAGVIDSVGVLELIEHLEATYGLQIPDADVLPENLDSIGAIARYVSQRLDGASDAG